MKLFALTLLFLPIQAQDKPFALPNEDLLQIKNQQLELLKTNSDLLDAKVSVTELEKKVQTLIQSLQQLQLRIEAKHGCKLSQVSLTEITCKKNATPTSKPESK